MHNLHHSALDKCIRQLNQSCSSCLHGHSPPLRQPRGYRTARSEWNPESLLEQRFDVERARGANSNRQTPPMQTNNPTRSRECFVKGSP
jgi:hypothetical protein